MKYRIPHRCMTLVFITLLFGQSDISLLEAKETKPGELAAALQQGKVESVNSVNSVDVVQYKEVEGGNLKLHLFYPENFNPETPRPCIVFFFGGGWSGGTPAQFYPQAKYLASRGMVGISAEYRTKKSHGAQPFQCVEDGRSAIRYLREHAVELGVIANKISAGGGSAGGHVAAATATVSKFDCPKDNLKVTAIPDALVLFNPVYDNGPGGYGHNRVQDYWQDFSPMHNISKDMPPTLTMLGDKDRLIPVATAEKFKNLMLDQGVRSELIIYQDQAHGFFNLRSNQTTRKNFLETVTAMDKFLKSLGYLEGEPTVEDWLEKQEKPKNR